jgi:hypothetical protein
MLGLLVQIVVFLSVPIDLFSFTVIALNLLLMTALAFMVEEGRENIRGPMSPLRAGFGFWFVFPGGTTALFGGISAFIGCLAAAFGAYLIIGEWLRRRG